MNLCGLTLQLIVLGVCTKEFPGVEAKDGPSGDVLEPVAMLRLIGLILRRVVAYVHVAPHVRLLAPCVDLGCGVSTLRSLHS